MTRPHPFIDRLACTWLIRRFINPNAVIRYSSHRKADEVAFDMKDAEFGHSGNLCSFETMLQRFGLEETGLKACAKRACGIAQIVHELDLRDGLSAPPEATGVETICRGWLLAGLSDIELEIRGITLFEGLYLAFSL